MIPLLYDLPRLAFQRARSGGCWRRIGAHDRSCIADALDDCCVIADTLADLR